MDKKMKCIGLLAVLLTALWSWKHGTDFTRGFTFGIFLVTWMNLVGQFAYNAALDRKQKRA